MNGTLGNKILIVDDEAAICDTLCRYLQSRGFETASATHWMEALRLMEAVRPNIVLMDLKMPEINGIDLLKRMKKLIPDLKVIMISAMQDERLLKECFEAGALDYICKPIDFGCLDARIMGKLLTR